MGDEGVADPVSLVMVGIGGYGHHYLKTLFDELPAETWRLSAAVDSEAERAPLHDELRSRDVLIVGSLEELEERPDLVVIASPPQLHAPQTLEALALDSHVLCDQPLATTVEAAQEVVGAAAAAEGQQVRLGYQWSHSTAIQELKGDIMKGLFGVPQRMRSLCLWPRGRSYYRRNAWAGRVRDAEGRVVRDSPALNAMAPFLHNLLYLNGQELKRSDTPGPVTAVVYRAHDIESYDTVACRTRTESGVELFFYASHAGRDPWRPRFRIEFEDASVSCGEKGDDIVAVDAEGRRKGYGSPESDHPFRKLFEAIDAVRTELPVVCGPEASLGHVQCIEAIQETLGEIPVFPETLLRGDEDRLYVEGLDEVLLGAYGSWTLPPFKRLLG